MIRLDLKHRGDRIRGQATGTLNDRSAVKSTLNAFKLSEYKQVISIFSRKSLGCESRAAITAWREVL